jgi:hypothetical protein
VFWVEPSRPLQSHGLTCGVGAGVGVCGSNILEALGIIGSCIEVTGQMMELGRVQGGQIAIVGAENGLELMQ